MSLILQKQVTLMGILNLTPDSFSDGMPGASTADFVSKAEKLIADGADCLDIGAESTRPGALPVSVDEQNLRILGFLTEFRKKHPNFPVSLDTTSFEVVCAAYKIGIQCVNDVSFFSDHRLAEFCTTHRISYVLMHSRGTPSNMTTLTDYPDGVLVGVMNEMRQQIELWQKNGGDPALLILDPGFGFAKTREQCVELMSRLAIFRQFERPLLLGISRKSFLQHYVESALPVQRDSLSAALALQAVCCGFNVIRTHHVAMTKKVLTAFLDG